MDALLTSEGWKHVVSDALDVLESFKLELTEETDYGKMRDLQGQVKQLTYLTRLDEIVQTQKELLNASV